jgi:hypothetical protein
MYAGKTKADLEKLKLQKKREAARSEIDKNSQMVRPPSARLRPSTATSRRT